MSGIPEKAGSAGEGPMPKPVDANPKGRPEESPADWAALAGFPGTAGHLAAGPDQRRDPGAAAGGDPPPYGAPAAAAAGPRPVDGDLRAAGPPAPARVHSAALTRGGRDGRVVNLPRDHPGGAGPG